MDQVRDGRRALPANLPALTSLRLFLAVGVVLFHYQLQWAWDSDHATGLFERARLGVDVFFILSGFVLTHAYRHVVEAGRFSYRDFLVARLARIYPLHLLMLGVTLATVAGATMLHDGFDHSQYTGQGLWLTVTMMRAWFPTGIDFEWNGPSWSLSAEWFAYLAFPAFAWIGLKWAQRPIALLALSGAVFLALDAFYRAYAGVTVVQAQTNFGILRIIPEFLYGVALYRLAERLQPARATVVATSIASAVSLAVAMHLNADDRLIVALSGALVLSLALLSRTQAEGWFASRWLQFGGEASFALYLVHMPILVIWKGVSAVMFGVDSHYALGLGEVCGLLAVSLAAGAALHLWFERPARVWAKALADRGPIAAAV